jgi:hypothetical protein
VHQAGAKKVDQEHAEVGTSFRSRTMNSQTGTSRSRHSMVP